MTDLMIRSQRVVTGNKVQPALIAIERGKIKEIIPFPHEINLSTDIPLEDVGNLAVFPGLVDTHVHINEPGRTDWEGFTTATGAAASGGITTLVDMPLNCSPVTTTALALQMKMAATANQLHVDCGFYGGVIPNHAQHIEPLIDEGVLGFKCFLIDSGIDEFPHVSEDDLREGLPLLAKRNVPLLVHAELDTGHADTGGAHEKYATYLASRPRAWENAAIEMMIRLSGEYNARSHIVHLSSSDALGALHTARNRGINISVETCHHYLSIASEDIPDGATRYKCAPPIREQENQGKLWDGLRKGIIDFVVSDHSPCLPKLKLPEKGDFIDAWGGIAGLQFSLPVFLTEAQARGIDLVQAAHWLSAAPAEFAGLVGRKGKIEAGYDADLVILAPEEEFVVTRDIVRHKHDITPYEGRKLRGVVHKTYLQGKTVFENGNLASSPQGEVLRR